MRMAKLVALGDLVEAVETWNPSRSRVADTFKYIDIGAVDAGSKAILEPRELPTADAPSRARQLVRAGDVLVSTVRPNLNAVAQVPVSLDGATASTGFCALRARSRQLDARYLLHWVKTPAFVIEMTRKATGASYPAVSDRTILESRIPLPPLAEQRRIADVLDRVEALRAKRRTGITQLDALVGAIFADMFGDPIRNPKGFPVVPMVDLIDPQRPISYGILMPGPDQIDGVKYIRVVDMKDGRIDPSGIRRTTPAISHSYRRSLLKAGDLLMSIRGHVGRFAAVPQQLDGANITQDTARLAVNGASPIFVRECLRMEGFQRWMAKHTKGVAVRGINLADVKLMPVMTPPRREQEVFADRVATVESLATQHRASLAELDALFAVLQHRAFQGDL